MRLPLMIVSALVIGSAGLSHANEDAARIADVKIKRDSPDQPGIYHIRVTIEHEDQGWDDYTEAWEIYGPDGDRSWAFALSSNPSWSANKPYPHLPAS